MSEVPPDQDPESRPARPPSRWPFVAPGLNRPPAPFGREEKRADNAGVDIYGEARAAAGQPEEAEAAGAADERRRSEASSSGDGPFLGGSDSTTGVPYYSPPASPPPLPGGPALAPAPEGPAAAAPPKRSVWRPLGRGLREVAETILLALLIFLLVRAVVQNFQVEGRSMEPTLQSEWFLLVNKALYWEINLETLDKFLPFIDPGEDPTRYIFRGPERGDVVVFASPDQEPGETERDFIKRVIALPGETVEVYDCTVFIDGEPLYEPYVFEPPHYTLEPQVVPPGEYFVLGDNRNSSSDSKTWGPVPKDNIIGQAFLIYWPFDFFGLVDNNSVTPGEGEPPDLLTDAQESGVCPAKP